MNKNSLYWYLIIFISLSSCQNQDAGNTVSKDYIVKINERGITQQELDIYKMDMANKQPQQHYSDAELLDQLIQTDLWATQARNKLLQDNPDNFIRVKQMTEQYYAAKAKQNFHSINPIDLKKIKAEYYRRYPEGSSSQVKLLFIENPNRDKIVKIIHSLKMGANPRKLVGLMGNTNTQLEESVWQDITTLAPDLVNEIRLLEDNQFTQEPLNSKNGWRVIFQEDSRIVPAPKLNEVRANITADLMQQKNAVHTQVLLLEADISRK